MLGNHDQLYALCSSIQHHLEANPSDFSAINEAVQSGINSAITNINLQRARADQAMLAALALADTKRLTEDMKVILCRRISTAIHEGSASPVERAFLAKAKGE